MMKKDSEEGKRLKLESLKQRRGRPCNKFPPNVPLEERPSRYIVRSVYIGVGNARRWGNVKQRLGFTGDVDFVAFLLRIAESLPASKGDKPIDIATAMTALAATAQRFLDGFPLQNGHDNKEDSCDEGDDDLSEHSYHSDSPLEEVAPVIDIPTALLEKEAKVKKKIISGIEKEEQPEADPFAFQDFPDPPLPLNIRASVGITECLNLTMEDKNRACYNCSSKHSESDCPLLNPVSSVTDYRGEPDFLDEKAEERLKAKSEGKAEGKSDSDEDSNNLKIDELKEEKEGMSAAGEEKLNDEPELAKSAYANRLLEGALLAAETPLSMASLPRALRLEQRDPNHGLSVIARGAIQGFTQFGPLLGIPVRETDVSEEFPMRYIWEVYGESGKHYVSVLDPQRSNWFRYLRPAASREERNLAAVIRGDLLYLVSIGEIKDGEELQFWVDDPSPIWAKKKIDKLNCGGCSCSFDHPLYYRTHVNIFHDPNFSLTVRKFFCKICGVALLGKEALVKHAAEEHEGKGAYQCSFCGKYFLRPNYLEMHRNYGCAANPNRERPQCHLCGKKFCQPQKLKIHVKKIHGVEVDPADEQKQYPCKFCEQVLATRAALHRHHRETHNKETGGACACDTCGKLFQNKSNLKIHMLTHSGVKPFRCPVEGCEMGFSTKQVTQVHLKKAHGYDDDNMPHVERTIPYTFDAYSAGNVRDLSRGKVLPEVFDGSVRPLENGQIDCPPANMSIPEPVKPLALSPDLTVADDGSAKKKRGRPLGWRKPKQDANGLPEPAEDLPKKKRKKSDSPTKKTKGKSIFDAADLKAFYAAAADLQSSFAQGKFPLSFEQNQDIKENGEPLFANKEMFSNFSSQDGSFKEDGHQFMPADLSFPATHDSSGFAEQGHESSTSGDLAEQVLDLANHHRNDEDKPSFRTFAPDIPDLAQAQDLSHSPRRDFENFETPSEHHDDFHEQFQGEDFRNESWRKDQHMDQGIDMSVARNIQHEIVAQDVAHNLVSQEVSRMSQSISRHDIAHLTEDMEGQRVVREDMAEHHGQQQPNPLNQDLSAHHDRGRSSNGEYHQPKAQHYVQERLGSSYPYDFDSRQYEQPTESPRRQASPQMGSQSQWRGQNEVHIPQMSPLSPNQNRQMEPRVQNESPLSFAKPQNQNMKRSESLQDRGSPLPSPMPNISIEEKDLSINLHRTAFANHLGPSRPLSPPQCPLPPSHMQDSGYGLSMTPHIGVHSANQVNLSMAQYPGIQPTHSMLHSSFSSLQSRMRNTTSVDPSRCTTPSHESLSRILAPSVTPLSQASLPYPTPSPSPGFHVQNRMGYQSYQNLANYQNYQNYALQTASPYAPRPTHPYSQNPPMYNPYGGYY